METRIISLAKTCARKMKNITVARQGIGINPMLNLAPIIPDGTPTAAYDVTDTGFKVVSSVDTKIETVVTLEYGTVSETYTDTVTAAESPVSSVGDVNFTLTGLTPFTDYYFRVKAVSSAGTSYSQEFVQKTAEPAIISDGNTVAWYDFASGITKDGSNFVSAWNSRIGTNHLAQAVGTNQPLLTADGVLFDGVDNFMKAAAFTFNQPEFIYLVVNQKTWTVGRYLIDGNSGDTGTIYNRTSSPIVVAAAGAVGANNSDLSLNTYHIVRLLFNGASSKLQIDGNSATTGNFGANNMRGLTLAARGSNNTFSNVEFKEIILRKVADNSTDEAAIYNYLKKKYSL